MTNLTMDKAQAEMTALFAQARKDHAAGVSAWQISRSLLSEFWSRFYKLPRSVAPEFMTWFRPKHEELGKEFSKSWKPMKEKQHGRSLG